MPVTLTNDFHNTSVRVSVTSLPHTLSYKQWQRVRNVLCGQRGCECGTVRGRQWSLEYGRIRVVQSGRLDEYRIEEVPR